uniref:WDR63 n=1 Tax=Denticeps clupeoides TaxID=299321 RepID=A0AAY4DBC1_9TELE
MTGKPPKSPASNAVHNGQGTSSKRIKSTASNMSIKSKGNDKTHSAQSPAPDRCLSGHPDDIHPIVLTSVTQEHFECRVEQDVTSDNPFKPLKRADIVQDMKARAAVSDFSPIKQAVMDYPEEEMLLVFDSDFKYGQSFYLVLTVEAKQRILSDIMPNVQNSVEEQTSEKIMQKTPTHQPWKSLGSEREIDDEIVKDTRSRLKVEIFRVRRDFGAEVTFSDRSAVSAKDAFVECISHHYKNLSLNLTERNITVHAIANTRTLSTQTKWTYPKNMCTQYEFRQFTEEEKEKCLLSENLKTFASSVAVRCEIAIQQNVITDIFFDDWATLSEVISTHGDKTDSHLKEYQSFTDLCYSKDKMISYISWHPNISGLIAVAMTERLSFEQRISGSTKLLLNPPLILFWGFSDPINPQLLLKCPDDIFSFQFCPSDPNIIVGGCKNGQIVLWDISLHHEQLKGIRGGGGRNMSTTNQVFEDKQENLTSVVHYCAVSSIEDGHKAPITDIQWLRESFEITRMGIPVENKNMMCVQVVTCASDCSVMFWDIRVPCVIAQSQTDRKKKMEQKLLEKPHGIPTTFKHLDLSWRPLFRVSLQKIDSGGEYRPVKFSFRDNTCDNQTVSLTDKPVFNKERPDITEYSQLLVPSDKHLKPLENISTNLYIGTEEGELVYTDWKLEKDESGRLQCAKPSQCLFTLNSQVNTVQHSPFFKDIILIVAGWTFAIWKEEITQGPVMQSPYSEKKYSGGCWSLSRPGVLFFGTEDGDIEVWNLVEKTHKSFHTQNITTSQITCIRPWINHSKQNLLAASDQSGTLHILEIPWMLHSPSKHEKLNMSKYFEKEVERLMYSCTKRQAMRPKDKKNTNVDEQRGKVV